MSTMKVRRFRMLKILSLATAVLMAFTLASAPKHVLAADFDGSVTLYGYNVDTNSWDGDYTTGNLGKSWNEGEWVPGKAELRGIQAKYPGLSGMPDIEIRYDAYNSGKNAMFIDLVKSIQVGSTDTHPLGALHGWPSAGGAPMPLGTEANVYTAQNDPAVNSFTGYEQIDADRNLVYGADLGWQTAQRKFVITADQLIAAGHQYTDNLTIYFQLHLARSFLWENDLQVFYADPTSPAYNWGGHIYSDPGFNNVLYGSGKLPGSSGHFAMATTSGTRTVPLPDVVEPYRTITGMKFLDLNNNGLKDPGEPGIGGWPIQITGLVDGMTISKTIHTNPDGTYTFEDLAIGAKLEITEGMLVGGYYQTFPNKDTPPISVATATQFPMESPNWGWYVDRSQSKETISGLDFGNFLPNPSIKVTKTGDTLSKIGDETSFTVTIENTGNVPLTRNFVKDNTLNIDLTDRFLPELAIGAKDTVTFIAPIPQNASDPFINEVEASYSYLNTGASDSSTHSVNLFQPLSSIQKDVSKEYATLGETVTYTIKVENKSSADTPMLHYHLKDALLGIDETFSLLPGQSKTVTKDYTVPLDAGDKIDNTASIHVTVEGFPNTYDYEDSASLKIYKPSLLVEKTGDKLSKVGDEVEYTIRIINTGNVPLNRISVMDSLVGDITSKFAEVIPVGEFTSYSYKFIVPEGATDPMENKVSVEYSYMGYSAKGDATHSANLFQPSFTLKKSVSKSYALVGEEVTYTLEVKNTSSDDTPDLIFKLEDPKLGVVENFTLASGGTFKKDYKFSIPDLPSDVFENTATLDVGVTGFPNTYSAKDTMQVQIIRPMIVITKTGDLLSKIGDDTSFTFKVENKGNVPLTLVSVIDTPFGDISSHFKKELAPGEIDTVTLSFKIPPDATDPFINTVEAKYIHKEYKAENTDTHSVNLFQPTITLKKTVDKNITMAGDTLKYTIRVENNSSADSPDLVFTEFKDSILGDLPGFTLKSGEYSEKTYNYEVKATDVSPMKNIASISASPVGFPNVLTAKDSADVQIFKPDMSITKRADTEISKVGDTINYTIVVKNETKEAFAPDLKFRLTDPLLGLDETFTLASGKEKEFKVPYIVKPGDDNPMATGWVELKNTATVSAETIGFESLSQMTKSDSAVVNLVHPAILLTKTVDKSTAMVGETVNYTITIKNVGDVKLENITVKDTMMGDLSTHFVNEMDPGDSDFYSYPLLLAEVHIGTLENTATVHANPITLPNDITDDNTATVVVKPADFDETAWAIDTQRPKMAIPFNDRKVFRAEKFDNWGWTNGPYKEGAYRLDLYAAAGGNILSKGYHVGYVDLNYTKGIAVVTYTLFDAFALEEVHLHVGNDLLPKTVSGKQTLYTNAPGQFPFGENHLDGVKTWTVEIPGLKGDIYIAAHAVVTIPYYMKK